MQWDSALDSEFGQRSDVVDDAMGEVGCGANEEDGVAVDEAGDGGDVDLIGGGGAGDQVDLDAEVFACFAECSVSCFWENPANLVSIESVLRVGCRTFLVQ